MADPMHSLSSLFASVSFPFHHRTPFCHSHAGCPLRPIHLPCRALYRNGSTMTKAELESSGKERGGKLQKKKKKKKKKRRRVHQQALCHTRRGPGDWVAGTKSSCRCGGDGAGCEDGSIASPFVFYLFIHSFIFFVASLVRVIIYHSSPLTPATCLLPHRRSRPGSAWSLVCDISLWREQ